MRTVDIIAKVLLIIGGINWGLWGLFEFDLVAALFGGSTAALSRVIYTLVGIAALYVLAQWNAMQRRACLAEGHGQPMRPARGM